MTPHEDILSLLSPTNSKPISVLVIDHDVTRYHSLDFLRYTLYTDVITGNSSHFSSLNHDYDFLLGGKSYNDLVNMARLNIREFNVLDCFSQESRASMGEYAEALGKFLSDTESKITETDMNSDFGNLFIHREISGSILRHAGDIHIPPWVSSVAVYESTNIFDPNVASSIIAKRHVGVVMLSSTLLALDIAMTLRSNGMQRPMTFIIARYGYNFVRAGGKLLYPLYGDEMNVESRTHHTDFGFFNPFGKRKGG